VVSLVGVAVTLLIHVLLNWVVVAVSVLVTRVITLSTTLVQADVSGLAASIASIVLLQ
jgi:hypothetical protein